MAPHVMRGMLFSKTKQQLGMATLVSSVLSAAWYFFYMKPKYQRYDHYFKTLDPYQRLAEICAHDKGYMHSCPQELAKLYAEKGIAIAK